MSEHRALVEWYAAGDFAGGKYSRDHRWKFDGGVVVNASAAPASVRPPYSNPEYVDPEEAFVASIASCHLLTFLYVAHKAGFLVARYRDDAVGTLTKNEEGVPWVSAVVLSPLVEYAGAQIPTRAEELELHEKAHHGCYIANSVKTLIRVELPSSAEA